MWTSLHRAAVTFLLLAASVATSSSGQTPAQAPASASPAYDGPIAASRPVEVSLRKGLIYHATVAAERAMLRMHLRGEPSRWSLVVPVPGPRGQTSFEVYPLDDGVHQLFLSEPAGVMRLRLEVDSALSAQRATRDSAPRLTLGLEVMLGAHGGYDAGLADAGAGSGAILDGCLSFRQGRRLGLCLGYAKDQIEGLEGGIGYYYGEFRYTLLDRVTGKEPWTAGFSARAVMGGTSRTGDAVEPSILAAGLWGAWWLTHSTTGRGLALRSSLSWARYGNLPGEKVVEVPREPPPGEPDLPTTYIVPNTRSEGALRWLVGVNWHP